MLVLSALAAVETAYRAVKRRVVAATRIWSWSRGARGREEPNAEECAVEAWQEMERDPAVRAMLHGRAVAGPYG